MRRASRDARRRALRDSSAAGGLAYVAYRGGRSTLALTVLVATLLASVGLAMASGRLADSGVQDPPEGLAIPQAHAQAAELLATGLKAGALSFGGAYTAIPFVQDDAGDTTNG